MEDLGFLLDNTVAVPLRQVIGGNIARLRGITQEELSAKLGITQGLLSRIECGYKNLTTDTIERFAMAMGVAPAALLEGWKAPDEESQV
jgi:transcriptional regulator with XRE-family HTH domain